MYEIGELLFSAAEQLFNSADGLDELLDSQPEIDIGNLSPELEELRVAGCRALSALTDMIDLPLNELEDAFKDTKVTSAIGAVIKLEKRIIGRARLKGAEDEGSSNYSLLEKFIEEMVDRESNDAENLSGFLDPITFDYKDVQKAIDALNDAHIYVCNPSLLVTEKITPINKLRSVASLCRDAGFLTADAAAVCGGIAEPTGILLFTSGKSIVTSTMRIRKTLAKMSMTNRTNRKAAESHFEFEQEKLIVQDAIRRIKNKKVKKISSGKTDPSEE